MRLINNLQLEFTQIIIRTNSLLNKRQIEELRRRVWIEEIKDTCEYSYRVEVNYVKCGCLIMESGEWIKTKESYDELNEVLEKYYKANIERNDKTNNN